MSLEHHRVVEIDIPTCALTHAVLPCESTSPVACYNSPHSCHDIANIDMSGIYTLKFSTNSVNIGFEYLPYINGNGGINVSQAESDPGVSIGKRGRVTINFIDPRAGDPMDQYLDTRNVIASDRGTFFGRLFARYKTLNEFELRIKNITIDENGTTTEVSTEHYFVDKFSFKNGKAQIQALDVFSFVDDKKSLCPEPSTGRLQAQLDELDATFSVENDPLIYNTYLSTGWVAIGKEIIQYTRVNEVFTIDDRAQFGTDLKTKHNINSTVQQVKISEGDLTTILEDLLSNYTNVPTEYITNSKPLWDLESEQFPLSYYRIIAKPTPVAELLSDLVSNAFLNFFVNNKNETIEMQYLREQVSTKFYTPDNCSFVDASYDSSNVFNSIANYISQINPQESKKDTSNYEVVVQYVDENPENILISGNNNKIQYSPWINTLNLSVAEHVNESYIGTFGLPRERASFELPFEDSPRVGEYIDVSHFNFQDVDGVIESPQMVVTSVKDKYPIALIEAAKFDAPTPKVDSGVLIIPLYDNASDVNLRDVFDTHFPGYVFTADTEIIFGSVSGTPVEFSHLEVLGTGNNFGQSVGTPQADIGWACVTGDWPEMGAPHNITITLRSVNVAGFSGEGMGTIRFPGSGTLTVANGNGMRGGNGLRATVPLTIELCNIYGGGGGGGGPTSLDIGEDSILGGYGAGALSIRPRPDFATLRTQDHTLTTAGPPINGGANGGNNSLPGSNYPGEPVGKGEGGVAGIAASGTALITNVGSTYYGQTYP